MEITLDRFTPVRDGWEMGNLSAGGYTPVLQAIQEAGMELRETLQALMICSNRIGQDPNEKEGMQSPIRSA